MESSAIPFHLRVIIVFRDIIYVIIILYSWILIIYEHFWLYIWNNWSWVIHMISTWFWHENRIWHSGQRAKGTATWCVRVVAQGEFTDRDLRQWLAPDPSVWWWGVQPLAPDVVLPSLASFRPCGLPAPPRLPFSTLILHRVKTSLNRRQTTRMSQIASNDIQCNQVNLRHQNKTRSHEPAHHNTFNKKTCHNT
jgi:hypothetical protein